MGLFSRLKKLVPASWMAATSERGHEPSPFRTRRERSVRPQVEQLEERSTPAYVSISAANQGMVVEGAGSTTLTATVEFSNVPPNQGASVTVATSSGGGQGSATPGNDFTDFSTVVSVNNPYMMPMTFKQTVNVTILPDKLSENPEGFSVNLSNPIGADFDPNKSSSAAIMILDDGDASPTVQFSTSSASVGEAAGTAAVTVTLSGASGKTILAAYAYAGGTATMGSDVTLSMGTLTFDPGVTS